MEIEKGDTPTQGQPSPETRQVKSATKRAMKKKERVQGKERLVKGQGSAIMQRAMRITRMDEPIEDLGDGWFKVPSEQGKGMSYQVFLGSAHRFEERMEAVHLMPPTEDGDDDYCECPFFLKCGFCKHIVAANIWNAVRVKGQQPKNKERKQTYKNPPDYDRLKVREMRAVNEMIRCITGIIEAPRRFSRGRKPKPLGDAVREVLYQANSAKASRKAIPEPSLMVRRDFLDQTMAFTTRLKYMRDARVRNALVSLIDISTEDIRHMESAFSVDSTTVRAPASRFDIVENVTEVTVDENGKETRTTASVTRRAVNCKLHLAVANESKMIVAAEVTDENVNDTQPFEDLVTRVGRRFVVKSVLADAAYCWPDNYELVGRYGADAFIDFVVDRGQGKGKYPTMDRMFKMYRDHYHDEWRPGYTPRAAVECANSMLKRNSYRRVRAKSRLAREVELLALCLIHNLAILAALWEKWSLTLRWLDERAIKVLRGEEVFDVRPEEPDKDLDDEDAFGPDEAA